MTPRLITCDWGTTSLRAYLLDEAGAVLDARSAPDGIMAVPAGGFPQTLTRVAGDWARAHGPLPVVLSGMVGARQGWREAGYVSCPAGLADIATGLIRVDDAPAGFGPVFIVPGLLKDHADRPDVIRGEETEILGALALGGDPDGLYVLPGTHSKWVELAGGRMRAFTTYMTGELFAAVRGATILGRMMTDGPFRPAAFARGVAAAGEMERPGDLIARLFGVRALGLTGRLADGDSADYLSGLLIGAELVAASDGTPFTIVAGAALADRYAAAARELGLACRQAPEPCGPAGQVAVARAAGLLG